HYMLHNWLAPLRHEVERHAPGESIGHLILRSTNWRHISGNGDNFRNYGGLNLCLSGMRRRRSW
ncbi:hypothetical protein A2U01_0116039, partial [Trifolium medium]|nr:hypothetical protein [Trifolium medium]